jgi:hypothetical protein
MWKLRAIFCAWAAAVCLGLGGCGQSRQSVHGSVTIDGTPMDLGMITFVPEDTSQTSVGGKISDGKFSLDATRGPLPGKYRVEIRWAKKTGRKVPNGDGGMQDETAEGLPAKYNTDTELTATIGSWGSNSVDFNLTP